MYGPSGSHRPEMRLGPGFVPWKEGVLGGALVPGSQVLWQEQENLLPGFVAGEAN